MSFFGRQSADEVDALTDAIATKLRPLIGRMVTEAVGLAVGEAARQAAAQAVTEAIRPLEARVDIVHPEGRQPDEPVAILQHEERSRSAAWTYQESPAGRARQLAGQGLGGKTLAAQMMLEGRHGPSVQLVEVPGHPEFAAAAAERDLASRQARLTQQHGTGTWSDTTNQ
jgi:phage baseplate assembly protein W